MTAVRQNLTHLRISWKTHLNSIEPLYILVNESKMNPFPKKLKEGETYLRLNPCLSHSLRPQTCITSTTTDIQAEGERCQSNQITKTRAILESQNKNISALAIVFAGFGLGLGLVGFVSDIIIAF